MIGYKALYKVVLLILGLTLLLTGFALLFSVKPDTDYIVVVERVRVSSVLVLLGGFSLISYILTRNF